MSKLIAFTGTAALMAVAGALPALAPAHAGVIVNGGFESPGGTVRDQLTSSYLPGWSYDDNSGNAFDIYESDDQGDGLAAADGSHYGSFGHSGTNGGSLTQTLATVAGHMYHLSLWTAEQQGDDQTQQFAVYLTSAITGTEGFGIGNLTSTFTETTVDFAAAGATTLTILDATPAGDGAGSNLALDRVSVTDLSAGAVPEPASWALFVAGFGVVGAAARRRRGVVAA